MVFVEVDAGPIELLEPAEVKDLVRKGELIPDELIDFEEKQSAKRSPNCIADLF